MSTSKAPAQSGRSPTRDESARLAAQSAVVLRRFRVVFNAVKTHFRQVEKSSGIGGAQLWALSVVNDKAGIGITDLAVSLDVHQSTASNLVKSLAKKGLIGTTKERSDRRSVSLYITAKGAKILESAPGPLSGVLPVALGSLDMETLCRLDRDLSKLIQVLGADEAAAGIPLAQI